MTIDIQVGEVSGFRLFRAAPDGRLESYAVHHAWSPGTNTAACGGRKKGHGPVPALGCRCGFWMYRDLARCASMFRHELMGNDKPGRFGSFEPRHRGVLARCDGWGRVLEGDDGWRVEKARINCLLDVGQRVDLRPWAEAYDVLIVSAEIDLSLTCIGRLTALGEDVGREMRTGIRVGRRLLVVRTDSMIFLQLWQLPLGSPVKVVLDPETGDVAGIRLLDEEEVPDG